MRSDRNSSAKSGLSLVELLVALALMALLAAGLAGAFGIGVRVFDRAQQLDRSWPEIAARRQLRNYLMQAMPSNRQTVFPSQFTGTARRFEFVTLADAPYAPDSAALRVSVIHESGLLTLSVTALDDDGAAQRTWSQTLSENLNDVTIRYMSSSETGPTWRTDWQAQQALPLLIDITAEGGDPEWVRFAAAPRLR